MSGILRIEMLLLSLLFLIYIVSSVNRGTFLLKNAITWLTISAVLVVFSIFPQLPEQLAKKLGFETTSNFLMLGAIFVLFIIEIRNTVLLSKQQNQIKTLIQELSIFKSEQEKD